MPYDTISLGLTLKVPTAGTKNWAKTYLDDFAKKVSSHDHTGSGKGVQLGTNALGSKIVTAAKIADGTITNTQIADTTIAGAKLQNGTVNHFQLTDLSVTTAKIAAGAVTTGNIATHAITNGLIDDLPAGTAFTPVENQGISGNLSSHTYTGRWWVFGPLVIARYEITLVFSSAPVSDEYSFDWPTPPKTAEGAQKWVAIGNVDAGFSTAKFIGTHFQAITGNGSSADQLFVTPPDGITIVNTDRLRFQAFAIYPGR